MINKLDRLILELRLTPQVGALLPGQLMLLFWLVVLRTYIFPHASAWEAGSGGA